MTAVLALVCAVIGFGSLAYATHDDGAAGPTAPAIVGSTPSPGSTGPRQEPRKTPQARSTEKKTGTAHTWGAVLAPSLPVRLSIPSVKIDTGLLRLGLNDDGSLQVPWKPLLAGWYEDSPTPGELGPSVIAGHVDSWATGPAVFYHLGQVVVGAHVLITRADSSVADFEVTAVRSYLKTDFPTRLVYGDVDHPELRLMTCGDWNSTTQEYDGNVIVFGRLLNA